MEKNRLDDLERHVGLLALLRNRHMEWAKQTNNLEVIEIHRGIADLFGKTLDQYNVLLGKYAQPPDEGDAR
jgi:hypothetical protein